MAPILFVDGDPINHPPIEISNDSLLSELPRHPTTLSNVQKDEKMNDIICNGSWQHISKPDENQVNVVRYENSSEEEARKIHMILESYDNFIVAAANGDIVGLKNGLESGVKVNRVTSKGFTALVIAITEMQVEAVKFLLENGADAHQRVNSLPPLAHAASRLERGPELLQLLMDYGTNLNTVSRPDCRNVLHCAAAVGTVETIEFLVKKGGMDLEKKCRRGCTPLIVAARAGNVRNIKALLSLGAKLNVVSQNGGTPLIWSSGWENVEAVKFWLGTDVDIDAQDYQGRTALFLACDRGALDVVNELLGSAADPNIMCTARGAISPLQVAIEADNVEIIKALAAHGADLIQKNSFGENALDIALADRRPKAIRALLEVLGGEDYPKESVALEIAMGKGHNTVQALMSTVKLMYPYIADHNRGMTLDNFGWMDWVLNEGGNLIRSRATYKMMHVALEEQNVEMVGALAMQGCPIDALLESGHTPLSFAVGHRNLELIKVLLKFGADPTRSWAGGSNRTPLDDAILDMKHGEDTAVVNLLLATDRCLINRGKDPFRTVFSYVLMKAAKFPQQGWERLGVRMLQSVKDVNKDRCAVGCSLLHIATLRENVEFIDIILSKGADIETTDELGVTPLIMACQRSPKLIPILIERGADINALYKSKSEVLAGAASYGNVESLKVLLEIYGRDIEVKTEKGHTPLACALTWGEEEAALYLIEKGANVHWKSQEWSQTALHFAAKERLVKVVEELLKRDVDVDAKDAKGWTPLHEACAIGNVETIRMLLNAGADIEAALPNGDRPLHVALINEKQDSALCLINRGADIKARASGNRTPLHICSEYDLPFVARILLDRGVSTEDIDDETWTPLCCCASANFADVLIDNGANVNYKDKDEWSPLHQAIYRRDYEFAEVLRMNGADAEVRTTDDGLSVMERAMDLPNRQDAAMFVRLLTRTARFKDMDEVKKETVGTMDCNVEEEAIDEEVIDEEVIDEEVIDEEEDEEGDDVGGKSVLV